MPFEEDDDNDDTTPESPAATRGRLAKHLRVLANSVETAESLIDTLEGNDRNFLIKALIRECFEIRDAAEDLGNNLGRTLNSEIGTSG